MSGKSRKLNCSKTFDIRYYLLDRSEQDIVRLSFKTYLLSNKESKEHADNLLKVVDSLDYNLKSLLQQTCFNENCIFTYDFLQNIKSLTFKNKIFTMELYVSQDSQLRDSFLETELYNLTNEISNYLSESLNDIDIHLSKVKLH